MPSPGLTCQQQAVVQAEGSVFVEACPGAGKTRAMVARFLKRTDEEPRKGIALISFTNAAIDEVTRRCAERPEVLTVPNFVGTFDSFINRFITRPLYVRDHGRTPRFVDSWATLGIGEFRLTNMGQLPPLDLDWFELEAGLSHAVLRPGSGWGRYQVTFDELVASRRQDMELKAGAICRGLVADGTVSCEASRALAAGYLADPPTHDLIGRLLAARFSEVIVDETQDCGPAELMVLRLLQEFAVDVVAVADLDQSIFEFRRADPEGVLAFAATFDNRLTLDGNFRSSPAICALNSSLRHGPGVDQAVGEHAELITKVQVVTFRGNSSIAERIEVLAASYSLTAEEVIFLAHKWTDARKYAGVAENSVSNPNRVLTIAKAHSVLSTPTSGGRERLRAVEAMERIIRFMARAPEEPDKGVSPDVLDDRWLREAAIRLAVSLDPAGMTPTVYATAVREHLQRIVWPGEVTVATNLGSLMRAPTASEWQVEADEPGSFRAATIHSVKGQEFPGVVVILPSNLIKDSVGLHAVDHWDGGTASELRRIVYVGGSRAQQLLILAVHETHLERVVGLLDRDAVPYDRHDQRASRRRRRG